MKYYVYQIEIENYYQIGSTNNIKRRMAEHISKLRLNKHANRKMQNTYNKYKEFSYLILHEFDSREEAYKKEQELLDLNFGKKEYLMCSNVACGAPTGDLNPMKNKESVEKLKKSLNTEKSRKERSLRMTGEKNHMKTPELRAKFSELFKGENNPMYGKISPMRGKKNAGASKYMKGRIGENHPSYGKKLSAEQRACISQRTKGENNPMYGKTGAYSVRSIVIIDNETNRFYFSMKEYCESNNTSMYICRKKIKNGQLRCTT